MTTAAMNIIIKSAREIDLMRDAGRVVWRVLNEIETAVRPGVTTGELNGIAERIIRDSGGTALFRGVKNPQAKFPFPASICASVNEEVVHGIPSNRVLKAGEIVSVDCGVRLKGYCGDSARTFCVGTVSPEIRKLLNVTQECLDLAISEVRPGVLWSDVARKVQRLAESNGFGVVREFVGHGIGREMHEDPKVPNYSDRQQRKDDFELVPGMTLAVEPMITAGSHKVDFSDGARWTVATKDRSAAAHFEHTIAVTADGVDILTDGR